MSTATNYYSLQGRVSFGKRNSDGSLGPVAWAQNVSALELTMTVDTTDLKESHSGQRLVDCKFTTGKSMTTKLTLYGLKVDHLVKALWATLYAVTAGTASSEAAPMGLAVGDIVQLDHRHVSAVTGVDSTGTPVTLVAGTHYNVLSAAAGQIEIVSLTGITQPLLFSYSYSDSNALALLTTRPDDHYLIFDGKDTEGGASVYVEIPRHYIKPASSLPLINNDGLGTLEMEGEALYDGTNVNFPFGKLEFTAAP